MSIADLLASLEASHLAGSIRDSLYLFPLDRVVPRPRFDDGVRHDCDRRSAAAGRRLDSPAVHAASSSDVLKWTWLAFALTVVDRRADVHHQRRRLLSQLLFPVQDGVARAVRDQHADLRADRGAVGSVAGTGTRWRRSPGRTVAALSLLFWISIIFVGRWIGFTTTRAAPTTDSDVNIEALLPK